MKTIILHGHLREKFGAEHPFDVITPAEAVRALCSMLPGFKQHVMDNSMPGYRIYMDDEVVPSVECIGLHTSAKTIRIVPVIAGSGGKSGLSQIIIGIVMIAAAWATSGTSLAWMSAPLAGMGASMVVGGLATMLAGSADVDTGSERPENKPSFVFSGVTNLSGVQGAAVALCYGTHLCGSQVASGSLSVDQLDSSGAVISIGA